ncbi:cobalamin biosynthesis protein CbiB [Shewanella colwelliana]|uniref:cobalamin biosynthesis protein CobD/CbiB n=1 Tax=Shewanella colwelliana TaxID=23 RepID=UPI001BC13DFE|nr:cobalamin biosynthesis protein [Shewanella colwelliana]GIU21671.1 cobalamin biosynthesis protein CbiB [Shewanella colwelliana]
MLPDFTQLLANESPLYQGALTLLVAIVLAKLAPLPREAQAFYWFSLLAKSLAAKVNRRHRTASQQVTAGIMATILLVLPFWLIATFLVELAAFPWFFEFIILYLCLCDEQFHKVAEEVAQALKRDDKTSARRLLTPWMYRDTQELSEIGLVKATIERLVTSPVYGSVATILFFTLGGIPLVLGARMIKQLEYCWPSLNPRFSNFGRPVYYLSYGLYYLPTLCWNFSLAIQAGPKALLMLLRPKKSLYRVNNHLPSCEIAAHALNIELGGPIKMNGTKIRVETIGDGPKPNADNLKPALTLVSTAINIWVLSVIVIPAMWATLRYLQSVS